MATEIKGIAKDIRFGKDRFYIFPFIGKNVEILYSETIKIEYRIARTNTNGKFIIYTENTKEIIEFPFNQNDNLENIIYKLRIALNNLDILDLNITEPDEITLRQMQEQAKVAEKERFESMTPEQQLVYLKQRELENQEKNQSTERCPRCGSSNIIYQREQSDTFGIATNKVVIQKNKRSKGCLYWLFIGWWWTPIYILLIGWWKSLLFGGHQKSGTNYYMSTSINSTIAVCQGCGNSWKVLPVKKKRTTPNTIKKKSITNDNKQKKDSALSILAFLISLFGFAYVSTIGLVLAIIDIKRSDKNKQHGWSYAAIGVFVGWVFLFILVNSGTDSETATAPIETISQEQEETQGIIGVEVEVPEDEKYGSIDRFHYKISEDRVVLDSYIGKNEILEIKPTYIIDGVEYKTDISDFQVGIGNSKVKTLILDEGFTEVKTSIFNSCDVESVYFPKSMTNIYDYTLSYLHPDDEKTIKIYYAGTQDEWAQIFTEYKRKKIEDTEFGEEMGSAMADKVNEMIGAEYDSSLFEYYFSASPDDLK